MRSLRPSRVVRLLFLAPVLLLAAALQAQSAADIDKVVSLMKAGNYSYDTTRSSSVWTIHFAGDHLKDIKVVVAVGEGPDASLIAFVTVTEKRHMPVTTDFMRTLLEQDHKMDRVKIAYDADGDLEVRIDAKLRVTDAEEFQNIVNQVKSASDDLYGIIQPQLTE